jgi:hypothetical protein
MTFNLRMERAVYLSKAVMAAVLVATLSSCASDSHPRIGIPTCERPLPVTEETWNDLQRLRNSYSTRALIDEKCIEKLRERIRLHDDKD